MENDGVSCYYSDCDKILPSAFPRPHVTTTKSNFKTSLTLIIYCPGILAYKNIQREIKNRTTHYISCFREIFESQQFPSVSG